MTRDELNLKMNSILQQCNWPPFDACATGDVLLDVLETHWDEFSDETCALLLGVAICLKKYYADKTMADIGAECVIQNMRGL